MKLRLTPSDFVTLVVRRYEAGRGLFTKKVNAEELTPIGLGPKQKANYIFYVLQLDYAMKSQILYRGANELHKVKPEFFTPEFIMAAKESELVKLLKKYLHPRYINEALRRYRANTSVLLKDYNGDARKIFEKTSRCTEVLNRLKGFRGFGPKIGNFFIRTMINTFDYQYEDIDAILPPVDVHDVRISYLLGFSESADMSQRNIHYVKRLWNEACIKAKRSWLVFDKALWLLGSEGKPRSKEDILKILEFTGDKKDRL